MSSETSVAVLWQRLESWASENAPEMLRDLNPGANDADIDALEETFGHNLPRCYRGSLKSHNGESDGWPSRVFANLGAYHSTEAAINDYKTYLSVADQAPEFDEAEIAEQVADGIITVDGPVQPLTFCSDWLPIMNCNGDVFWALDFAPANGGQKGQIIQVDLECCYWAVVAPDFETFLEQYVASLEAGDYKVQDGLPTKDPRSESELVIDDALASSMTRDELEKMKAGEIVQLIGCRTGRVRDNRSVMAITGGAIDLHGSLKGVSPGQVIKVTVRVGKPRAFGLLAPIHEIVEWGVVE